MKAAILALVAMTLMCAWLIDGQETAKAQRDDYRRSLEQATSQPIPTVTQRVTSPPRVVTKTIRVTERASRSNARSTVSNTKTDSSGPMAGWKARYWAQAQQWAGEAKTRAVIMCESTDRVNAVSATGKYRGLYQIDRDFWASYGGLELAARPDLATRQEQNYVAYRGFVSRGWSPWSCA